MRLSKLEEVTLDSYDGQRHRLGDLWRDRPVVVAFLRHYGCSFCREHGILLAQRYAEVQSKGAEIIAIGTGDAPFAAAFARDEQIPFPVLVDDRGIAAEAAEVRSASFLRLIADPRMLRAGRAGRQAGTLPPLRRSQMKGTRRVTQLAANFVIGPGSTVHFSHYAEHGGDHPSIDTIIDAIPVQTTGTMGRASVT